MPFPAVLVMNPKGDEGQRWEFDNLKKAPSQYHTVCRLSEMGNYPAIMDGDLNQVWDLVPDRQPSILISECAKGYV